MRGHVEIARFEPTVGGSVSGYASHNTNWDSNIAGKIGVFASSLRHVVNIAVSTSLQTCFEGGWSIRLCYFAAFSLQICHVKFAMTRKYQEKTNLLQMFMLSGLLADPAQSICSPLYAHHVFSDRLVHSGS
ncbi:hypothetical protein AVEN_64514-1 [Araneus ventricosus]|uniref:Uncharacterized protein n=1 Tax=Araneus ventricosus TaxID=182803 RepID=A0A4Y2GN55_ARAVE|nr:hypothetical protein AVEN_64514-1 [Araneus ventricosus]